MMRANQEAVLGLCLPKLADRLGQEPQHAAGLLKIGIVDVLRLSVVSSSGWNG